jgi:hypothetical protein
MGRPQGTYQFHICGKSIEMRALILVFALVSSAASAQDTKSCRETVGDKLSKQYVSQCLEVSPATHPPCNAANSCDLITSEIARGCQMIHQSLVDDPKTGQGKDGLKEPKYCGGYLRASR